MIRRSDITVFADGVTPEGGVYITVKDDTGALATLYDDAAALKANPFTSDAVTGAFYYNIADADAGGFLEEYRLSLSDSPRTIRAVYLSVMGATGPPGPIGPTGSIEISGVAWVTPQQFGAVGDGVTNDGAAFVAAIAYLKSIAGNVNGTTYKGSPALFIPAGNYNLGSTTLDLTHTLRIIGEGTGLDGGIPTRLKWNANTTAIRLQRYNTSGASTVDGVTHFGADGSSLDGLNIVGTYSGVEGEYHGIHAKCRFKISNCYISSFAGDGIHSIAGAGGGPNEGNTNLSVIDTVAVSGCRDGLQVAGGDANVWSIRSLNTQFNRRWGRNDTSFLANAYYDGHSDLNGLTPGTPSTVVTNAGNRFAVVNGQEVGASVNSPPATAIDNTWWYYIYPGGVDAALNIPAWTNGMSVRAGGAALYGNANAPTTVVGSYTESGQGPVQASAPATIMGGLQGAGVVGDAAFFDGGNTDTGMRIRSNLQITGKRGFNTTGLDIKGVAVSAIGCTTNTAYGGIKVADARLYYYTSAGLFHDWRINDVQIATLDGAALNLVGGVYKIAGNQVVGAQGAAVADPASITSIAGVNAVAAPTKAEFDALVAVVNAIRTDTASTRTSVVANNARLRTHGLYI